MVYRITKNDGVSNRLGFPARHDDTGEDFDRWYSRAQANSDRDYRLSDKPDARDLMAMDQNRVDMDAMLLLQKDALKRPRPPIPEPARPTRQLSFSFGEKD